MDMLEVCSDDLRAMFSWRASIRSIRRCPIRNGAPTLGGANRLRINQNSPNITEFRVFFHTHPETLPETNSQFAPENGWLDYNRFLLEWLIFRGYMWISGSVIPQLIASEFRQIMVYMSCSTLSHCIVTPRPTHGWWIFTNVNKIYNP